MGPAWVTCPSLSQSLGWGTCSWCPQTVLPTGPCKAWGAVVSEGGRGGLSRHSRAGGCLGAPFRPARSLTPLAVPKCLLTPHPHHSCPSGAGGSSQRRVLPLGAPSRGLPPARAMAWPPQPLSPPPPSGVIPHPQPGASTRQWQTGAVVLKPRPCGQGLPDTGRERVSNTDEAELPARPPLFICRSRMPATRVWATTLREHSAHKLPCHVIRSVDPYLIRPRQEVHPWTQLPVLGSLRDTGIPSSSPGRGKWACPGFSADDGPP